MGLGRGCRPKRTPSNPGEGGSEGAHIRTVDGFLISSWPNTCRHVSMSSIAGRTPSPPPASHHGRRHVARTARRCHRTPRAQPPRCRPIRAPSPLAVLPILGQLVTDELEHAGAQHYQIAARRLKKMRQLAAGSSEASAVDKLINELRETHRRRPRLQSEFDRARLP